MINGQLEPSAQIIEKRQAVGLWLGQLLLQMFFYSPYSVLHFLLTLNAIGVGICSSVHHRSYLVFHLGYLPGPIRCFFLGGGVGATPEKSLKPIKIVLISNGCIKRGLPNADFPKHIKPRLFYKYLQVDFLLLRDLWAQISLLCIMGHICMSIDPFQLVPNIRSRKIVRRRRGRRKGG